MLSHSGSRFHIYRNAATRGARLSPQLAGGRLALTSNRSRSGGTPQGSASSGSGKGGTSFFNTIFPPLTGHHTTSATQQSTVAGDVSSGYGTLEGGSLNNSLELSESTAAAFLIIDSHKYSEDMRCSDFQYVANEVWLTAVCLNLLLLRGLSTDVYFVRIWSLYMQHHYSNDPTTTSISSCRRILICTCGKAEVNHSIIV